MVSASRLQRLQEIVSAQLSALPDKPAISDDDESGGVPLDPEHTIAPPATHSDAHGPPEGSPAPRSVEFDENLERRFEYIQGAVSSCNPASSSSSSPKPPVALTSKFPPTNWKQGDVAPIGQAFAPILALSKYPYKFCEAKHKQDVASSFFDGGKFWAREWDLCVSICLIHAPSNIHSQVSTCGTLSPKPSHLFLSVRANFNNS